VSFTSLLPSLAKLWRDNGADPIWLPKDFEEAKARGLAIAGTPAMVRDELARQVDASGANYVLCRFAFGNLSEDAARQSLDLVVDQVAPAFPGALAQ
jgi:alkanesulfonate monooxygenase SsuD/methylene tetrahydromethanopterin reductase-like flavin-dependent oxidoreductase (luciferase family)